MNFMRDWTIVILLGMMGVPTLISGLSLPEEGPRKTERSMRDVLAAIEARLGDEGPCMMGRMDAFEARLGRIEAKLEEHLSRIREGEIAKEVLKEPSASELGKKMDSTAEKLFARLGIFEAKSNIQMTAVGVKIQRMERQLGRSMDDTLDKILKIEEKNTQMMENLWTMAVGRSDSDGRSSREEPVKIRAAVDVQLQDDEGQEDEGSSSSPSCPSTLLLHNLTTAIAEASMVGQKKVEELDKDVEIYTRKVLNAFRELTVEHKGLENGLNKVEGLGNHTQEMIREGVRRILQHMKPVTGFDDILQSLHKKVSKFENTIDASFASLLVAQNTFISLLQGLVTKMDEKASSPGLPLYSSSDVLWTAIESHRKDVGRALHDLVWTVIKMGNDTMEQMASTFGKLQPQPQDCPCSSVTSTQNNREAREGHSDAGESSVSSTASPQEEAQEEEEKEDGKEMNEITNKSNHETNSEVTDQTN